MTVAYVGARLDVCKGHVPCRRQVQVAAAPPLVCAISADELHVPTHNVISCQLQVCGVGTHICARALAAVTPGESSARTPMMGAAQSVTPADEVALAHLDGGGAAAGAGSSDGSGDGMRPGDQLRVLGTCPGATHSSTHKLWTFNLVDAAGRCIVHFDVRHGPTGKGHVVRNTQSPEYVR